MVKAKITSSQQAVGMVMADMLEAVTAFGFVEALILDLPTALGHAEQRTNSHSGGRKICQPVGFHRRAIWFVLTIEEDAHGFPAQRIPGIEVVGLPEQGLASRAGIQ